MPGVVRLVKYPSGLRSRSFDYRNSLAHQGCAAELQRRPSPCRPRRRFWSRRSWARRWSRTAPSRTGSACGPTTPSATTPSAGTGAAPSSASRCPRLGLAPAALDVVVLVSFGGGGMRRERTCVCSSLRNLAWFFVAASGCCVFRACSSFQRHEWNVDRGCLRVSHALLVFYMFNLLNGTIGWLL